MRIFPYTFLALCFPLLGCAADENTTKAPDASAAAAVDAAVTPPDASVFTPQMQLERACSGLSGTEVDAPGAANRSGLGTPWAPPADMRHILPGTTGLGADFSTAIFGWVRVKTTIGDRVLILIPGDVGNPGRQTQKTKVRAFVDTQELAVTQERAQVPSLDWPFCSFANVAHSFVATGPSVDISFEIGNFAPGDVISERLAGHISVHAQ